MLEFPDLWEDPDIQEFFDNAYSITGDLNTYPPCREEESVFYIENLTKNTGNLLFTRELSIMTPAASDILLQITHAQPDKETQETENQTINIRKWLFTAIDGGRNSTVLRLDSSHNTAGNFSLPEP